MSQMQMQNELNYSMSVKVIKKMLEKNLISADEYRKIDQLNRASFSPKLAPLMA